MGAFLLRLLTSRLAGPIATAVALILALALAWQTVKLVSARSSLKRAEDRIAALNRDLSTCRSNVTTLDAARKRQNDLLAARSAQDAQRLADATKRLSEAQQGRERAEARAAKLLKVGPVGVDACARAMDAFKTVKEQAR